MEEAKIENDRVIRQLKEHLGSLKCRNTKNFQGQTRESNESLDSHFHLVKTLMENYAELLPTLGKSLSEMKVVKEFEFDPDTVSKIYRESNMVAPLEDSIDAFEQRPSKEAKQSNNQIKEVSEKKGFGWSLLSKITNGLNDDKPPSTKSQGSTLTQETNGSVGRNSQLDISVEADKEWEIEVFRPILSGLPAKSLDLKITHLIESGNYVPSKKRGLLWRKLVSNRGRLNRRLFMLLLGLMDKANPSVRESIVKDMDRTYGEFKISPTYCEVKNEAIKVLQLFDVTQRLNPDSPA